MTAHRWMPDDRCDVCAIHRSWVGARYGCNGVPRPERCISRVLFRTCGAKGVRSPLRLEVEAAGVPWELYRNRRRSGRTHDEAIRFSDKRCLRKEKA